MILPHSNFHPNSNGEQYLWDKFREYLPNDWVSFHNYNISLKEADIMLLVPDLGILVIENKSILAKNIVQVVDNSNILMKREIIPSPLKQAKCYRDMLVNEYLRQSGIDSVYVIQCVVYPYISESEFSVKGLSRISDRKITILKDDFISRDTLLEKIRSIFDVAYDVFKDPSLIRGGFNTDLLEKVGNLISPGFRSSAEVDVPEDCDDVPEITASEMKVYSKLIYSSDGSFFSENAIETLYREWRSGTKLQLYSSAKAAVDRILRYFENAVDKNGLSEVNGGAFKIEHGMCFRFEAGTVNTEANDFAIDSGENYLEYSDSLRWLDENSDFNYGQYQMEHAARTNIVVRAGAGTGKTFSLISRINYLLWADDVDPEEFSRFLVMITFTNESADHMENKLIENFYNFYQLTRDSRYLSFLESVSDVNISTIDSLSRQILSKYSVKLGLGKDFSITSGSYQRNIILRNNLNEYFRNDPGNISIVPKNTTMFHFERGLSNLFDRLDNKNIRLDSKIDMGHDSSDGCKALPDGVINVLKKTQAEFDAQLRENDSVCLGDLVRKLDVLTEKLSQNDFRESDKIRYLFIDEFQDTDDVQISLIKRFQKLAGFKFFVVGDIKQSIYRFRGAEEQAFDVLLSGLDKNAYHTLALRKNYRTDANLLRSMNKTFSVMDTCEDIQYHGDDVLVPTKSSGLNTPFTMRACRKNSLDAVEFTDFVREMADSLPDDPNAKVAILVRYNKQIKDIVRMCHDHRISISTENGGELFSVDPTIDLLKLVLAMKYCQEPEYLYNLYTTSYVKDELPKWEIARVRNADITEYFYSNCPIKKWADYLQSLKTEPVLHVLQKIIWDVKPWNNFAEKATPSNDDESFHNEFYRNRVYYMRNLDQLFENILRCSNSEYLTINKLSDYLETMILTRQEAKEREQFGTSSDGVRVICTTVHKAKGLEYDTVILPYTFHDLSGRNDRGDVNIIYSNGRLGYRIADNRKQLFRNDIYDELKKDELDDLRREEMRILYVAMTRAQRRLCCYIPRDLRQGDVNWAVRIKESLK